jgi:hypothetical protein
MQEDDKAYCSVLLIEQARQSQTIIAEVDYAGVKRIHPRLDS